MNKQPLVEKASGEKEPFDPEKLRNSLRRAGTSDDITEEIVAGILLQLQPGMQTSEIYRKAFSMLRKHKNTNAARYSLKKAIMELGPSGYPFEEFVAQVLAHQGFDIQVGEIMQGRCVTHEVDVVATHNNTQYLVECKYYNSQGKYANVKVPLYIKSRVDDIISFREKLPEYRETRFHGWIVTNTRFTDDALQFGRCAGLHMLSWGVPKNKSLKDMIESTGVFPVTVLTGLNAKQKTYLLDKKVVLCRQLREKEYLLNELGFQGSKKRKILQEIDDLL
ncbi:MAG: ATP-binding protein [Bacteroidetes bacterium]|nr:MAG: ATP-binding protein [Bacteroidota bacterium]